LLFWVTRADKRAEAFQYFPCMPYMSCMVSYFQTISFRLSEDILF